MAPYKSTVLAKYITAYMNDMRVDINITKIQKLTYIAYGVYLAITGERLIDEHPQAWPYGPVFPTTRNKLLRVDLDAIGFDDPDLSEIKTDEDVKSIVGMVYDSYGSWSAYSLSEWSHKDGSPWEKTVSEQGFKWGDRIEDCHIQSYFKKKLKPAHEELEETTV